MKLYNFGTKINVEGSIPLLINAAMNLSSEKFQDYLRPSAKGEKKGERGKKGCKIINLAEVK